MEPIMKNFFWFIFISMLFLSISQICANDYTGTKTKVCIYDGPAGGGYAFNYYLQDIGYYRNVLNGLDFTNRVKYSFDLSNIPSNAYISNVSISVTCSNNSSQYKYIITQLSSNLTECYQIYDQIPTSSVLYQDISYQTNGTLSHNNSLSNLVNNNKGGHIYLGVYSEYEGWENTNADVNISLHVDVNLVSISADNYFNIAPANDGLMIVESVQRTTPYPFQKQVGQTSTFTAIPDQHDGQNYQRVWSTIAPVYNSQWREYKSSGPIQLNNTVTNISYTTLPLTTNDDGATFEAGLRKVCNIAVQNSFVGGANNGTIIVNGTQCNSPSQGNLVVEQNPITATAQSQTINGIDYTFSSWNNSTTQNPITFYPTGNMNISANFTGKPNIVGRNLHFNASNPNQPITVLWYEHPNANVTQYQIWRKVNYKKQGISSPVLIGTVNRGTTSFIDYDYSGTNLGYTDYMLWYDVKPYYSIESTVSVDNYVCVFSNGMLAKQGKNNTGNLTESVLENKMENYPNPFNPSTVITYQIVNQGHVSLKVYDCLGKEIAELVNKDQNSGKYNVIYNVDNLASGIYFYRIVANGYVETKKMIRMK